MDLVEDKTALSPDKEIEHLLDRERVEYLLEIMSDKEKEVLDMRFGLKDARVHTLAEVGKKLRLSRERVRQIEEEALGKLRKFVEAQQKSDDKKD